MNTHEPCPRIEALSALVDGELPGQERCEVEGHAAQCPLCAAWLAECRQLREEFALLETATPGFDVTPEVDRRISAPGTSRRPYASRPRRSARLRWWQVALFAPGGAVAVATGVWMGSALAPAVLAGAQPMAVKMVPFSAVPAGALCPVPHACEGTVR